MTSQSVADIKTSNDAIDAVLAWASGLKSEILK